MTREYPPFPVPSAAALVCHQGSLLLIRRKFEPGAGKWSLPGGKIELGETAEETAAREVMEECNVRVKVTRLLNAANAIFYDHEHRVRFHYLIIVYLAAYLSGTPENSEETLEVRWVPLEEAGNYDLTGTARSAIEAFIAGGY
ncbi:NUDIX hydrolase [Desulfallas sp. Bu1-1]|uniref:NUDIX hydrolase n=1 Tax=Desulfallas sp. Bu1-1 TaxID=2787620 RepID=UPI00189EB931|nr:NUDIX hydrolase [Desulfallas sp. Bu1-1]MBF7084657.1 NUDIX hydrolase [Desulfallas sp. Bu1-1]